MHLSCQCRPALALYSLDTYVITRFFICHRRGGDGQGHGMAHPLRTASPPGRKTIVELAEIVVEGYAKVTLRSRDQRRPQSSTQPVRCSCPCARSPKPSPMQRDKAYMTQHDSTRLVRRRPGPARSHLGFQNRHLEAWPWLE